MNLIPDSINGANRYAIYNCGICNNALTLKILPHRDSISLTCDPCKFDSDYTYVLSEGRYYWYRIDFTKYHISRKKEIFGVYLKLPSLRFLREPELVIQDINIETIKKLEKLMLL